MEIYIAYALIAVAAVLTCFVCLPMFKIIQLSGYKTRGVIAWWKSTSLDVLIRYAGLMLFGFITMIIFIGCFSVYEYVRYCAVALYDIFAVVFIVSAGKSGSNNVKYTGRMVRLMLTAAVVLIGLSALIAWASYVSVYCQTLVAALPIVSPFVAIAANYITTPFEKLNNNKYVKRAKAKLNDRAPIVIGITGSYGKTTAKNMLSCMLKTKYTVLATPGSYNTPMGVCKTINNDLNGEEYFIAELGARYKGDIKELCEIVKPKYGLITAVGDMHLETLGSRENVANVKFELGEAIDSDGLLVLNGYNKSCGELGERDTACKKQIVGEDNGIRYENLVIDGGGTKFDLVIDGEAYSVDSKLLGAHIAELICSCAAVALACGVEPDRIAAAANAMNAVEHRLQIVPSKDPSIIVIDDAYNSNPTGAKNALDVLACMNGKKIIITPGFVELGAIEKECNMTLGAQIKEVCDYAFLIGSRAADIKKGAVKAGMPDGVISVFDSRDNAVKALSDICGEKAILFENDLPDNIK